MKSSEWVEESADGGTEIWPVTVSGGQGHNQTPEHKNGPIWNGAPDWPHGE